MNLLLKKVPNKGNHFHIPEKAITHCKVTDKNGKDLTHRWCAPYLNPEQHGTPYAFWKSDENGRPVNNVAANDTIS